MEIFQEFPSSNTSEIRIISKIKDTLKTFDDFKNEQQKCTD